MKKQLGSLLFLVAWLVILPVFAFGQIPQPLISGLKSGDAKVIAAHFNENIELAILDQETVCSKAQGEQILADFLKQHRTLNFEISHQGGNESSYAIGKMTTSNGNFRIYFLIKSKEEKSLIVQLRIDKD
jgi:hypothetical protein